LIVKNLIIIGLGLVGVQRLSACIEAGIPTENLFVHDPSLDILKFRANSKFTKVTRLENIDTLAKHKISHAIVSVPHDQATSIVCYLLSAGIIVLMEKPLGRNLDEAEQLLNHPNSKNLSVGFNYRFMPGVKLLKDTLQSKSLGNISIVKFELGHGGSPDDKYSWKLSPVKAGGGVVLDPGIHLIDLLVYLFGANAENLEIKGITEWKGFWNTGIEESASFMGYVNDIPFSVTTSIVAWRTRFSIEVIGTERYLEVDGRGRSDGPQLIVEGFRWGWLRNLSQEKSESHRVAAITDLSIEIETLAWINDSSDVCKISSAYEGMKIYNLIKKQLVK
jgi:predicted dehydrogenase